jgi:hypothetical protein
MEAGNTDYKSLYPEETDKLVGAISQDSAAQNLDRAIKDAEEVIAGEETTITVPLDDFERYETDDDSGNGAYKSGDYKTDNDGNLIPLVVEVSYRVYDPEKIKAAAAALDTAINNAAGALSSFAQSSVTLSSGSRTDDTPYRSVTIVDAGVYQITITGASGGHAWAGDTSHTIFSRGGRGGLISAKRKFEKGDVLKIRIGEEGKGTAKLEGDTLIKAANPSGTNLPGGWPNGGNGGKEYNGSAPGAGGGGATEVYFAGNREDSGSLITFDKSVSDAVRDNTNLYLAAGGGGGAGGSPRITNVDGYGQSSIEGGDAGKEPIPAVRRGYPNETAFETTAAPQKYLLGSDLFAPYEYIKAGSYSMLKALNTTQGNYWYGEYAPTASVGYDSSNTGKGIAGRNGIKNQSGNNKSHEGSGGGGGGYTGGNALTNNSIEDSGSGGGGSNYIITDKNFTEVTIEGIKNQTASGYGNGKFVIEYLSTN